MITPNEARRALSPRFIFEWSVGSRCRDTPSNYQTFAQRNNNRATTSMCVCVWRRRRQRQQRRRRPRRYSKYTKFYIVLGYGYAFERCCVFFSLSFVYAFRTAVYMLLRPIVFFSSSSFDFIIIIERSVPHT